MEPNFELIVKALFDLSKGQKVKYSDLWDLHLNQLDVYLGSVSKVLYPNQNVPDEVCEFIDQLVNYIEKNHIIE